MTKSPPTADEHSGAMAAALGDVRAVAGAVSAGVPQPYLQWDPRPDDHFHSKTWTRAGMMMKTKSTGRKNRIIGTVSFGGSAAAFFSAAFMR